MGMPINLFLGYCSKKHFIKFSIFVEKNWLFSATLRVKLRKKILVKRFFDIPTCLHFFLIL